MSPHSGTQREISVFYGRLRDKNVLAVPDLRPRMYLVQPDAKFDSERRRAESLCAPRLHMGNVSIRNQELGDERAKWRDFQERLPDLHGGALGAFQFAADYHAVDGETNEEIFLMVAKHRELVRQALRVERANDGLVVFGRPPDRPRSEALRKQACFRFPPCAR